jgi:hypothetical protein
VPRSLLDCGTTGSASSADNTSTMTLPGGRRTDKVLSRRTPNFLPHPCGDVKMKQQSDGNCDAPDGSTNAICSARKAQTGPLPVLWCATPPPGSGKASPVLEPTGPLGRRQMPSQRGIPTTRGAMTARGRSRSIPSGPSPPSVPCPRPPRLLQELTVPLAPAAIHPTARRMEQSAYRPDTSPPSSSG